MREIELKLLLDEPGAVAFRRNAKLRKLGTGKARTNRLLTVYYDTINGALERDGLALRMRREGRVWTQTIKGDRRQSAGLSSSLEVSVAAPGGRVVIDAIPDETLKARVSGAINGHALNPVCSTDIRRTTWVLQTADGTAELALDVGDIQAGEQVAKLHEIEVELLGGHPRVLFDVVRELFPSGGLRFSTLSKAKRAGMLARDGRVIEEVIPRNARTVAITPDMTAEAVARDVLSECLEQIAANMSAVRLCEDPEAAHQLRIGLRRLRSACDIFADALRGPILDRLRDDARWLGQEVGRLRDLEVAVVDILEPEQARYPSEAGFERLKRALQPAIETERASLRQTITEERAQAFLLNLAEFVSIRGWLDPTDLNQTTRLALPVPSHARQVLDKVYKKSLRRGHGIQTLSIESRHDLRKQLKKFRYTVEFLAPLYSTEATAGFVKNLKKFQTILGELNDAAMIEALLMGETAPGADDALAARAAGRLIGARLERSDHAWLDARSRWDAFSKMTPFWRG